jgi:NTP pyrophosphatase (non-canonical NTP hydrolase)
MKLGIRKDDVVCFKQYIKKAKETESVDFNAIRRQLRDKQLLRLLHAGMGMVTETSELFVAIENMDLLNIQEELGDIFWYIAIAYDSLNCILEEEEDYLRSPFVPLSKWWNGCDNYKMEHMLLKNISKYIDVIKKRIYYGDVLNVDIILNTLQDIFNNVCWIMGDFSCINLEGVLSDNIKKLDKRYKNRFNKEGALNRDVENELSHMKRNK